MVLTLSFQNVFKKEKKNWSQLCGFMSDQKVLDYTLYVSVLTLGLHIGTYLHCLDYK